MVAAGDVVTYRVRLFNRGPGGAPDAQVRDALPAGLTWLPKRSDPRCAEEIDEIVCSAETALDAGESTQFVIRARIGQDVRGIVTNQIRGSSSQPDPNPGNNRARATITVTKPAPPTAAQRPLIKPPAVISPQGTTDLYPGPVPTNADQIARVKVTCRPIVSSLRITPRGDFRYCIITRRADGSISLTVQAAAPVSITIKVTAPAVPGYDAMDIRYRYRVGLSAAS